MIPMPFCESFVPWPRLKSAAESNCTRRNQRSTFWGRWRRTIKLVRTVKMMARIMPTNGGQKTTATRREKLVMDEARKCESNEDAQRATDWRLFRDVHTTIPRLRPGKRRPDFARNDSVSFLRSAGWWKALGVSRS